jgi:RND family efflux transporter MFP subunit
MTHRPLSAVALRALALGVTLALAACAEPAAPPPHAARQEATAPRPVATAAVAELAAPGSAASGAVHARQRATLTARAPATVRDLPVEEGAAVGAGQVVVRLDDQALRAALAAAEAGHAAARADADRLARLQERQAATPREVEAAAARAAAAAAGVAAARDALTHAVLRAPFAGRLADRMVNEGDVVMPGQPLVEVEGERGWELRADVAGDLAAALAPGARLGALVDGVGEVAATVRAVSPAGDPGTGRFEVIADLDGAPGLRSGLFARLQLPAVDAAAAELAVPAAAVFARGGLTGVFVAEEGAARLRWIALGERRGDLVAVRAGLEPGERVILDPAGLVDGAPVEDTAR